MSFEQEAFFRTDDFWTLISLGFVCAAAVGSYFLLRLTRWTRYTPMQALSAMVATAILTFFMAGAARSLFGPDSIVFGRNSCFGIWLFIAYCVSLFIVIRAVKAVRLLRTNWQASAFSDDAPAKAAATDEERRIILNTLAEGKVSPQEAEELLKAVGEKRIEKPATRWTVGFVIGTLLIAIGFVLPWAHFSHFGPLTGDMSQAGYQQGAIGWIVLVLGVLPAILMSIPALDRHMQLAYLRLILAGCGLALVSPWILSLAAFAINLVTVLLTGRQMIGSQTADARPGIGIALVLLGFAAQLIGAAVQSGLLRRRAPKPAPAR